MMKSKAIRYLLTILLLLSDQAYTSSPKKVGTKDVPAESFPAAVEHTGYATQSTIITAPPGGLAVMHETEKDTKSAAASEKKQKKNHRRSKSDSRYDINFRPDSTAVSESLYDSDASSGVYEFPKGSDFLSTATGVEHYGSDFHPNGTGVERYGSDYHSSATAVVHYSSDFYSSATAVVPRSESRYGDR